MTRRRDHLLLANEVALALVTVTAVVGMHRLFLDGSYRGPLVAAAIVAHATVAGLRRARVHLVPAALLTVAAAAIFIAWTRFPDTTRWLLPTGDTLSQAGDDIQAAWKLFGKVKAPAPVENGFLAVSVAAVWLIAFVADWAAFRVMATFEALLPATTLFVFSAALGGSGSPVAGAALFAGAALLFVLLQRTYNQERTSRWASRHGAQGRWSLLGTGALLTALAVVAGAIAGPQLPGADDDALLAWRDINRDKPTRVVPSPMVSLQTKQVEQQEIELFTVTSPRPEYWRLTALEQFDGEMWKSAYSTDDADGQLPRSLDVATDAETVTQRFDITQLASVWLPAAFEPQAIDTGSDDQPADFDPRSSTLMVDREVATSDGFSYEVTSAVPEPRRELLRTASTEVPDEIDEVFTQLPDDFPDRVTGLAQEVTLGADTTYDKALALQDYLRTLHLRPQRRPGTQQRRAGDVPVRQPAGLLRAVRRLLRRHGPRARHPGAGGGRVHPRGPRLGRPQPVPGPGRPRPRLARGLPRRVRLDQVRADPDPGSPRRRRVPRPARAAGGRHRRRHHGGAARPQRRRPGQRDRRRRDRRRDPRARSRRRARAAAARAPSRTPRSSPSRWPTPSS